MDAEIEVAETGSKQLSHKRILGPPVKARQKPKSVPNKTGGLHPMGKTQSQITVQLPISRDFWPHQPG
jgi:hypothetical protein